MNNKHFISFALILSIFIDVQGQETMTLQPDATQGKDALLHELASEANTNYGNYPQFIANAWTFNDMPAILRSLIHFDLSALPEHAEINSAYLSLYGNLSSESEGHSSTSGSNACLLQKVTSTWDESTVTWNSQPSTSPINQVLLDSSSSAKQDYINIDVSVHIQDMYENPESNYGFMLRLFNESYFRRMNFASSDHANNAVHPKLVINYFAPDTCVTIQPDAEKGKDALLHKLFTEVDNNYGDYPKVIANAWTFNGNDGINQSVIDFDLSNIPDEVEINSAYLSLYGLDTIDGIGHSTISGPNECWLQRITTDWEESTVTWNTRPSTTTDNQVAIYKSSNYTQDYLDIDVSDLVKDMYRKPESSFGFLLKLQTEEKYRRMVFASSDHNNADKHPKLVICYSIISSVSEKQTSKLTFNMYPNPAKHSVTINFKDLYQTSISLQIMNATGQLVESKEKIRSNTEIDLTNYSKGLYFINLTAEGFHASKKLIVE
jgi:hypothetical protein